MVYIQIEAEITVYQSSLFMFNSVVQTGVFDSQMSNFPAISWTAQDTFNEMKLDLDIVDH